MEKEAILEVDEIIKNCEKDIDYYNHFMQNLFYELSKKKFSFSKIKKSDLIKNMEKNVKNLVNYIYKLDEVKYKDIYNCLSCIYGAFLGDAIGAYCEFEGPSLNNTKLIFKGNPKFGESPGQVTDDSEMAMASGFAIMDIPESSNLNSDYLYYYYGLWHLSEPEDEGDTTYEALKDFNVFDFNPNRKNNYRKIFDGIQKSNSSSLANGFLMRTSPFIVWCYFRFKKQIIDAFNKKDKNQKELFDLFNKIKIEAKKDNICTHPNVSLPVAHSIFCIMGLGAICELKPNDIIDNIEMLLKNKYFNEKNRENSMTVRNMILEEIDTYKNDENKELSNSDKSFLYFTKGDKSVNTHIGFYYHAFRLTLYYLYYFNEIKEDKIYTKYRTIMNQICSFGGDTDTNAAIVGAVIGPLIGFKKFGDNDFKKMVNLVPKNRFIFSPALMILYVYFLKENNKEKKNMNFLRMLLNILYEKKDLKDLDNINSIEQ